jgi:hypothetical protein
MNYNGIEIGNDFFDELVSTAWDEDARVRNGVCIAMMHGVIILMLKSERDMRSEFYETATNIIEAQSSFPAFCSINDARMAAVIQVFNMLANLKGDEEKEK